MSALVIAWAAAGAAHQLRHAVAQVVEDRVDVVGDRLPLGRVVEVGADLADRQVGLRREDEDEQARHQGEVPARRVTRYRDPFRVDPKLSGVPEEFADARAELARNVPLDGFDPVAVAKSQASGERTASENPDSPSPMRPTRAAARHGDPGAAPAHPPSRTAAPRG